MQISANAENLILEIILVYFSSPATRLSWRHAGVSRRIREFSGEKLRALRGVCWESSSSVTHAALNETQATPQTYSRPSSHRATCHSVATSANPPITL